MMFKRKIQLTAMAVLTALSFTSCLNNEDPATTEQEQAISAEADIEEQYTDLDQVIYDAFDIQGMGPEGARVLATDKNNTTLKCATVTWDHNVETGGGTFKIDFGTDGCTGPYGRTRTGIVNISYTGGYWQSGSVITTTLENYAVNGVMVEGIRVVENVTDTGMPTFKITLTGGKLTFPNENTATRSASRFRVYDFSNMELLIYGTSEGTNRFGTDYVVTVDSQSPIVFSTGCQPNGRYFPVSGIQTITRSRNGNALSNVVVDYGEGICDSKVSVTTDNWTGEITIK
ncbi:hypothetical protein [Marinigracilibium pacificum]|uniref:Lipoprotein n=1 Tax=Marinigracilibium pacificum TaxID=2729599 RepID=A0A848IXF7_9BACT|nr:hypothetical protein [Marinigracilibium pacificum]NMM47991.1 hypothetical protein [Marinigracilibium pacificum]